MRPVEYVRPETLEQALSAGGTWLAGGQSLLPALWAGGRAEKLVDLGGLEELKRLEVTERGLWVGAMVTHARLAAHGGLLGGVAAQLADLQVRNRGTMGGVLGQADPRADYPAVLLACQAQVVVRGREVALEEFLESPGGLIEAVIVPECQGRYLRRSDRAAGWPVAGVCLIDGRLGVTAVAARPYRARASEAALAAGDVEGAIAALTEGVEVRSDLEAGAEYRSHLARCLLRELLA
ncbi:MAG: xanthine dehydrogenase family protein subunit M [Vulcanimicrobiota bacterium]